MSDAAHLGINVPGFPNRFVTFGPNTKLAHGGSAIFRFEFQVPYINQVLRDMIENGYKSVEIKHPVREAYSELVDRKSSNMVWAHPRVTNWYKNKRGGVTLTTP